jgi:phosphoserine phosphatase
MTTILLTRHGETEYNREVRFRGQVDVPLNEKGERQAAALAERLTEFPVRAVYTGPLQRAWRTGEICAQRLGLTPQVLPGLQDISYGDWQGRTLDEIRALYPEMFQRYITAPVGLRFPGGDTLEELVVRALGAMREVVARHPDDTLVLVAHQGVNKALLCGLLGLGLEHFWDIRQDECCLNVITCQSAQRYEIVSLNDTCHMKGIRQ